jgi:hypothetical protein
MIIEVTEADIREGCACDCDSCPVALAVGRATKEDGRVFSLDYELRLGIGPFSIPAPWPVRKFVMAFDDMGRVCDREQEKLPLPKQLPTDLAPFSFEVPDRDSPEWMEQCYDCEELFATDELDDEGYCADCRGDNA